MQIQKNDKKIDFAVGGQAVIEGVMMRSPNTIVVAVRKQNGSIKTHDRFYRTLTQRFKFLNIPFVRGIINLFEMMGVGMGAVNFSATESVSFQDPNNAESTEQKLSIWMKLLNAFLFLLSFVFAIALTILLFKFLPLWITTFLESKSIFIKDNYIIFNLIDGILKISFFVLYIFILSIIPSFRRIFEYHGAEHKSIFAYENNLPLTVENAKKQTRFHPRCGTSFILIVLLISIAVYTFVPRQETFTENLILRIALLPLIAGISYEYLKLSAKFANKGIAKILVAPGLWLQRITTKEPDDKQLEVALTSLKIALEKERKSTSSPPS
jgi:uncharacterized protein YqhQ